MQGIEYQKPHQYPPERVLTQYPELELVSLFPIGERRVLASSLSKLVYVGIIAVGLTLKQSSKPVLEESIVETVESVVASQTEEAVSEMTPVPTVTISRPPSEQFVVMLEGLESINAKKRAVDKRMELVRLEGQGGAGIVLPEYLENYRSPDPKNIRNIIPDDEFAWNIRGQKISWKYEMWEIKLNNSQLKPTARIAIRFANRKTGLISPEHIEGRVIFTKIQDENNKTVQIVSQGTAAIIDRSTEFR